MEIQINDPYYAEKSIAITALYRVMDPELFVNIMDLGLVYDLDFSKDNKIIVIMTLSTPHCPLEEAITSGVKNSMSIDFPGVEVEVKIVWEPAWNFTMMSEAAKEELGFDE
jgi:metal-sulfur cluster biosynthetic enzyme